MNPMLASTETPLRCVFERALLARHAVCDLAQSHQIAERESIACTQAAAHRSCAQLAQLLREKSSFALHLVSAQRILPHAMMMKIECGGLDGLRALLDAAALAPNVRRLVRLAEEAYGELGELPFSEVVQGVAAWKPRRRHSEAPR